VVGVAGGRCADKLRASYMEARSTGETISKMRKTMKSILSYSADHIRKRTIFLASVAVMILQADDHEDRYKGCDNSDRPTRALAQCTY